MSNPFDILPPKARLALYSVVAVALLGVSAWQAAEGNWLAFAVTFLSSISSTQSATKVDIPKTEPEPIDPDTEDFEDSPDEE